MRSGIIKEFTRACNPNMPNTPVEMGQNAVHFLIEMVNDEMRELAYAKDIYDQADAMVDAIYYICNSALQHGINLDPIIDIVHRANMSKLQNGRILRRGDGKILKPKGWKDPKPLIKAEIERQKKL